MSCLASSSRSTLPLKPFSGQIRTVIHHARPPRMPQLNSPHNPKQPLPTSGTSHLIPTRSNPVALPLVNPNASRLEGTNMTFHHSPPPSAPSYTTGSVPPLLQYVRGEQLHRTGEERAKRRKEPADRSEQVSWDAGVVERMRSMRAEGISRSRIAEELSLPASQIPLISRLAPLSADQKAEREAELEQQKSTWGYKKRLSREIRAKRKTFW